jgi:hypothetical protein
VMAWVPVFFAVAMALLALPDARELKAQADFRERLHILRMHSGSIRGPDGKRQAADDANLPAAPRAQRVPDR